MRFFISLYFLLSLCAPLIAQAAPFCANKQGLPSECYYDDADLCRARANEISGYCKINSEEIELPSQSDRYCMVAAGGIISCIYEDFETCDKVAVNNKGICAFNDQNNAPPQAFESDVDSIY